MDLQEIDLEFMEQEAEERLTLREALLLGLPSDPDRPHIVSDGAFGLTCLPITNGLTEATALGVSPGVLGKRG